MATECDFSFEMLYRAAYGKSLPLEEKSKLQSLAQQEINQLVTIWAQKAGWKTQQKIGKDRKSYLAFYP